jgi:hypothetical protein
MRHSKLTKEIVRHRGAEERAKELELYRVLVAAACHLARQLKSLGVIADLVEEV